MAHRYQILFVLCFLGNSLFACITCNSTLQDAIYQNQFSTTIYTLLGILLIIAFTILLFTKVINIYYRRYGAGHLNPTPLITASLVLGVGLGGFADGIVFHQLFQWHQMLSNKITPDTWMNKSINMFWDGIFHLSCLMIMVLGTYLLFKSLSNRTANSSPKLFVSALFTGWAIFNIVEGIIDHQIMKLHNVREGIDSQFWNSVFLIASIVLLFIGLWPIVKTLKQYLIKPLNQ